MVNVCFHYVILLRTTRVNTASRRASFVCYTQVCKGSIRLPPYQSAQYCSVCVRCRGYPQVDRTSVTIRQEPCCRDRHIIHGLSQPTILHFAGLPVVVMLPGATYIPGTLSLTADAAMFDMHLRRCFISLSAPRDRRILQASDGN